ncbi:hypothetical protein PR202_ga25174 [Eleusine coracana subsp. coracana]|uniref:BRCT domain-containing protein n=1 Tax=Eleusine coracana subsp. coracana TaxID=191504 RepID=A0AAV5DAS3_ELECO|nr:hypothetical protein PR202_ga25174 [Eleusine coracana subsp. coracana]
MDGVKICCSGFEKAEKAKIGELVTAMGGLLQTNSSTDVNFVIVKDVMAAKYKWAVDTLKKPVVTLNWLEQCWIEHRVVPHEPYRIPPFTGLNICVTRLNQGDKYVVAKRWGNIHIVNPRWVEQCVARRACVDENSYLICESSSAPSGIKGSLKEQHNPEISSASASFQPVPTTSVDDSVSTSQFVPASLGDAAKNNNTDIVGASSAQETNQMQVDSHAIVDSEAENDDLYLSNCRISLVGFDDKEMLRLVMMIRNGGGSRHILLSERLTHIVLGAPSDENPARGNHASISKTRAARSAKSSQQNGMVNIDDYHPSAQVTSEMNSGSSKSSNVFKGKTFGFSNSFSHDKIFEPDNSAIVQEQKDAHSFGISRNWLNIQQKQDNTPDTKVQKLNSSPAPSPVPAPYYPFSETQTESQIVVYEEDLTGRQKIIDRVRSQSINATPSNETP